MSPEQEPELLLVFQALEPTGAKRFDWRHPEVRRAQSSAARVALSRAAEAAAAPADTWGSHPAGGLAPRTDASGRTWYASLSHARQGAVAALLPNGPVGVDLERIDRPRPLHVGDKLAELGASRTALDDPRQLISLWTRVEALLKRERVGLPGWTRIHIPDAVPLTGEANLTFDGEPRWTHVQSLGEFWLACAAAGPCQSRLLPAVAALRLGPPKGPSTAPPTPVDAPPSDAPGS